MDVFEALLKLVLDEKSLNDIQAKLNKKKLKVGVNADFDKLSSDVDKLASKLKKVQFKMDNGHGISDYQNRIKSLIHDFEKYGISAKQAQTETKKLQDIFAKMQSMSGQSLVNEANKLEQEFKAVKASIDQAKLAYDKFNEPVSNDKKASLINKLNSFLTKNTAITQEAKGKLQNYVDELEDGVNLTRWNEINGILEETKNSMHGLGELVANLHQQFEQATEGLIKYENACNALGVSIKNTVNGVQELRDPAKVLKELLGQSSNGDGSMDKESEKLTDSWEGSMNGLSNTWTDTIDNIANSNGIMGLIDSLDWVLDKVSKVIDILEFLDSIGFGDGLIEGIKNVGQEHRVLVI